MYESLQNAHGQKSVAWNNTYNMIEIEQDMQEMLTHVIKPPAGSNTIGFKEVRFEREDFHFIIMLFLCAKILLSILNKRRCVQTGKIGVSQKIQHHWTRSIPENED